MQQFFVGRPLGQDVEESEDEADIFASIVYLWQDGESGRSLVASWHDSYEPSIHTQLDKHLKEGKPLFSMDLRS